MKLIIGIIIVLGCVAGGFVISKGNLLALWHPPELMIIGGAAFGASIPTPAALLNSITDLANIFFTGPYDSNASSSTITELEAFPRAIVSGTFPNVFPDGPNRGRPPQQWL